MVYILKCSNSSGITSPRQTVSVSVPMVYLIGYNRRPTSVRESLSCCKKRFASFLNGVSFLFCLCDRIQDHLFEECESEVVMVSLLRDRICPGDSETTAYSFIFTPVCVYFVPRNKKKVKRYCQYIIRRDCYVR